jgi:hypothetical protein
MANTYHLAQLNIGRIRGPIDGPIMADFVAWLPEINAVADNTPGFVWRLQTDEGDATAIRPFADEYMLVNMSVWDSVESLYQYTYQSQHKEVFSRRKEWFETLLTPYVVLWWIPAGHTPTVEEAKLRLDYLQQHGPTPHAFTFKKRFTVDDMLKHADSPF